MLWRNKFTILTAIIIIYLSLAGSQTFGSVSFINIPYIDKIGHFGFYFVFMAVIILEHRNYFRDTRHILLISLLPLTFGILMEFIQMILTSDRRGEILDALANSAGVVVAVYIWLILKPYYRNHIK